MTGKAENPTDNKPTAKGKETPATEKDFSWRKGKHEDSPTGHLNQRQKQFIKEYCLDFNQTQAAVRAGYSKNTCNRVGSRLMANVYIQAAVKKRLEEISEKIDISEERIIAEMKKLAFSKLTEYVDPDTGLLDLPGAIKDGVDLAPIQELTTYEMKDGRVGYKAKMFSKEKALEMLSRIRSMFKDTMKHTGSIAVATVDAKKLTEKQLQQVKELQIAIIGNGHGGNGRH